MAGRLNRVRGNPRTGKLHGFESSKAFLIPCATQVPSTLLTVLGFRISYATWDATCSYDYIVVNGKKYCGTSGPDGVASDGTIIWTAKSDSWCANEGSCEGWQLCWECPPCTESARQVLFAPYVAPAAHATAAAFDECCFD